MKNEIEDFLDLIHAEADTECVGSIFRITEDMDNKLVVEDLLYPFISNECTTFSDKAMELATHKVEDCYFSINNFWYKYRTRRTSSIRNLNAFVIDYDFYKIDKYKDLIPIEMYEQHIKATLPFEPTAVVDSGRGLYVIYVFKKASYKVTKLYKEIYKALIKSQIKFGADTIASLVTQVIRLPGTINSKSNSEVRILELNRESKYTLEQLATVLPYKQSEVIEYKKKNYTKLNKKNNKSINSELSTKNKRTYVGSYQERIIKDLKRLIKLRNDAYGGLEGYREQIIYIARTALKSLDIDNHNEILISGQLNQMFNDPLNKSEFKATVPYHATYAHRCHSISKIITRLNITREEQIELQTLCSRDIKNRNKLINARSKRKNRLLNMSEKEIQIFKRRSEVAKYIKLGKSIRTIANKLVVSKSLIEKDIAYINEHKYQFIKKIETFLDELYALITNDLFMHTLTQYKQKSLIQWSKTLIAVLE